MNKIKHKPSLAVACLLIVPGLSTPTIGIAETGNVVLWNKLGSNAEVTHSEVGPDGTLMGGNYAYEPGKFGNGYVRKGLWNWVEFPGQIMRNLAQRGAISMWIIPKVTQPQPYNYGVFGLLGHPYSGQTDTFFLYWGDGVTGQGIFGGIGSAGILTPNEPKQFVAQIGTPFHAAIAWNVNGIDGSSDRLRVYRDGQLISSSSASWNPAAIPAAGFIVGSSAESDGNSYDKYIVDNVVAYDYAKTDFSDRFIENPVDCQVGELPELSANISKKSGTQSARIWTISLGNDSRCPAENAQIDALNLTQVAGAACTPTVTTPASFPLGVGNIPAGAQVSGTASINFNGCPNVARFKVSIPFSSNDGEVSGSKTLTNQFR
ncbi:hypothetical protein BJL95_10660 [Methylomonas sp. LWB]|uniref:hypothetical protein n=1 Tax=Methylomonas sp. LWB TaxID=1905845 RepID=UPI0008DA93C1|nr:hypothetical protein [Methylomonas sp. LWB]OHX36234.1 hypothetical protein BJL95_10660 [Methylomonas sp. LWB]